ncbi:MAG: rod shape-determining protein MreD [Bacteroidales bacterium]|nr:rod shape-determining protein MreD [Bacteroidales bacterium]
MTLNVLLKYIGKFVFLVLLQVLVLNNINLTEYGITPYFYILLILLLPFGIPDWALLLFAFFLGLFIDMFSDTGGVHASATVFIAFLRPFVLKMLSGRDGYAPETSPRISWYGFNWFFKYTVILVIIHHLIFFLVLEFSFAHFLITLLKVFITGFFSTILIIISQYLVFRK